MKKKESEIKKSMKVAKEFLATDKSLSPAAKTIFELLFSLLVELLETIKELNNKLNLNSKNSSKPPSSDQFPRGSNKDGKKKGRKPGGQSGQKGSTLKKVDNPDEVKDHMPKGRCSCGAYLSKLESVGYSARQEWDLLIQTIITEHRAHNVNCTCGKKHHGLFPQNITNNTQYSEQVKAIASYFSQYQLVPFERAQEIFQDIFDLNIAAGTVCNANNSLYAHLEEFENKVKEALAESYRNNADETGINIAGKNNYLHVLSNDAYTLLYPHKNRGRIAMDEMGVLPEYRGVLVHDFYKPYLKYKCTHSFCGSHLLRELIFSEEQEDMFWAKKMRQLLQYSNYLVRKNQVTTARIEKIERKYANLIVQGHSECPPPKRVETKRKGLTSLFRNEKKAKSRCLLVRFRDYRDGILMFLYDPLVPFTNNLGERDLRMAKVHQKISGCFRSISGARTYARIRSYISTMKKQECNVLKGIVDAFSSSEATLNQLFG